MGDCAKIVPIALKPEPFSGRTLGLISIEEMGVAGLEPAEAEAGGFTVGLNTILDKPIQHISIYYSAPWQKNWIVKCCLELAFIEPCCPTCVPWINLSNEISPTNMSIPVSRR